MASKKSRIKGKTLDISEFLNAGDSMTVPVIDWAAEMENQGSMSEENTVKTTKVREQIIQTRQQLPSAPKAARGPNADIEKVPLNPPYVLRISNAPFTTTDSEVAHWLSVTISVEVASVKLVKGDGGQNRGYGQVEFKTREDLIGALNAESLKMNNRDIKLQLPEADVRNQTQHQRGGYNSNVEGDPDRSEEINWRSEPVKQAPIRREPDFSSMQRYEQPHRAPQAYEPQPAQRGYGRNEYEPPRQAASYDRYGPPDSRMGPPPSRPAPQMDYGRSGYPPAGPPGAYPPQMAPPQAYYDPRGYGPENMYPPQVDPRYGGDPRYAPGPPASHLPPTDRDRDRRQGYEPPRRDGGGRGGSRSGDDYVGRNAPLDRDRRGSQNSRHSPVSSEPEGDAPKERKRLVLQPRTKPLEENQTAEEIAASKATVFGGAKPVDTAAREREIEEKLLHQQHKDHPKTEGHTRRISERTLSTSSSTHAPKSPRPTANVADVKLAPHGHLRAKNGDGGNVQLLRRSVSGNSAAEETVGDQPAANMSLSQHSSTDSQPRRDHNSDENQMTRSTGAVQNGTYKAPTAWSRGKGGPVEERRDEISPEKSVSLDRGGEEESVEQHDDMRNEAGDGPMRRDQSLDEDGFIRADQPRRGGAGSGRGSGGGYGPREYRRGGGVAQPTVRSGGRVRSGRGGGSDRGGYISRGGGHPRDFHDGDAREPVRKISSSEHVEQQGSFDSGIDHSERRNSAGENGRRYERGGLTRGVADDRQAGRGKPPVGHGPPKERSDRGHQRHDRGGRPDKHRDRYVPAEKPPRMQQKEAQMKQANVPPPVYKDVNKFDMLDEVQDD